VARIFLCHASEDKAQVREVYQRLKALGFAPWLDEMDILPGQDWDYEIERALETADFVIVFLSTRSVEKVGYVQREFRRALYHAEEMPESFIHTIPVKLDNCLVPRRFSRHQWANLYEDGAFDRIVRALQHGLQQRSQPIPAPLTHDPSSARAEAAQPPDPQVSPSTSFPEVSATTDSALEPTFTNSIGMEFVLIPAGTFLMGSPDSDAVAYADGKPAHCVTISQPFYLGKYPVMQAQWEVVMGNNPSHFRGNPTYPVESVSWDNVQAFLHKLNEREGGVDYRLPTDAQWEYACRAGTQTPRYHPDLDAIAWYAANSNAHPQPVGQKVPNGWGLYDMLGNVCEWCIDVKRTYTADAVIDPIGPPSGGAPRVIRGGSWGDTALHVRAAYRHVIHPSAGNIYLGFRCECSGRRR
jgi:formylglycine-generating enzyme required for sulfatase activity